MVSRAITHDEKAFPNPDAFIPERFLDKNGQLKDKLNLDHHDAEIATFGFGRRICPGRYLALNSLWITMASVLAAFDLVSPLDDKGNIILPSTKSTSGLVV